MVDESLKEAIFCYGSIFSPRLHIKRAVIRNCMDFCMSNVQAKKKKKKLTGGGGGAGGGGGRRSGDEEQHKRNDTGRKINTKIREIINYCPLRKCHYSRRPNKVPCSYSFYSAMSHNLYSHTNTTKLSLFFKVTIQS